MIGRFFVINAGGALYSHAPGMLVSWGTLPHANEFQTAQSARYVSDKYPGSRVVEMRGKRMCEVENGE